MHREELKVFVAFHRWKTRDESVLLCRYHQYKDLWSSSSSSSTSNSNSRRMRTDTGQLSKTNLGPLLQRWPRITDRVSSHSQPPRQQQQQQQRLDAIRSQLEKRWFVAEGGGGGGVTTEGKSASRGGSSPGRRGGGSTVLQHGAIQSTAPGGQSLSYASWDRGRSTTTYSSESHAESKSADFTPMRMSSSMMMMQGSRRRPANTNQLLSSDIPIHSSTRDDHLSLLKSKGKNLNIDELM